MTTSPPQTPSQDVWPEEIRLSKAKDRLEIRFDDGAQFSLSAELLRVESPSAEVQGHGAGQKTTPAGKKRLTQFLEDQWVYLKQEYLDYMT